MGGAFAMGAIGGAIWHAFKGAQNSPRVTSYFRFPSFYLSFSSVVNRVFVFRRANFTCSTLF
jgi:hypothetical protein